MMTITMVTVVRSCDFANQTKPCSDSAALVRNHYFTRPFGDVCADESEYSTLIYFCFQ